MLQNKANSPVWGPCICSYFCLVCGGWGRKKNPHFQGKIQGQQLKGKIVSEFFFVFKQFSHFFTHFQNFSPRAFPFKTMGFSSRGEQKRRNKNKKNKTNRCCTLVVARLSASQFCVVFIVFQKRRIGQGNPSEIVATTGV